MGIIFAPRSVGYALATSPFFEPQAGTAVLSRGVGPPFSFWSHVPSTMRPSFLNDGSVGAKGDIMIERADEARPRSEIVWVALYSGLVLLLMLAWTT
jgi:hypothetical protein